jgi:hypothetical protein
MKGTASLSQAILRSTLVVNGPMFLLFFAPLGLFAVLVDAEFVSREYKWVGVLVFLVSFIAAWTWWSISVPRWRVWAYEHASDVRLLKQRAFEVGLTWPDQHVFDCTEIKSAAVRRRERALDVHTETSRDDEGHDRVGKQ